MKALAALLVTAVIFLGSCTMQRTAGRSGKVPPGQEKKISGKQSARDHAPGQRKKHLRYDYLMPVK
ncbi:quinol oxidase subunit 4 [Parapedobacter sp. 10938]|uniref:quinol oxidase subunit 4 n=1 Tax=Parapedobacter flavus TaxID=3110225 RepID=UPI002DBEBD0C|nr:quinol oxidase subunit 4 [Parapedobacter sp. 10938]MEC3880071.1 quinol oxidase subunit 4 [Parapedobacter sp. 10938]